MCKHELRASEAGTRVGNETGHVRGIIAFSLQITATITARRTRPSQPFVDIAEISKRRTTVTYAQESGNLDSRSGIVLGLARPRYDITIVQ